MSIIDTPLALLDRVLGRRAIPPDDPLVRRIERAMRRLAPDPLYERRLRSTVVNQYVADREGHARPRARKEMGRLGRAVLYASFGVALSVTAAGAAAQESLPDDFLFAAKLRLEEIRMQLAPVSLHDDLAAMALEERLSEVEALAAQGAWDRVNRAAPMVDQAATRLASFGLPADALELRGVHRHLAVLEAVLAEAPAAAQAGLERALAASVSASADPSGDPAAVPAGTEDTGHDGEPKKTPAPKKTPDQHVTPPAATPSAPGQAEADGPDPQGGPPSEQPVPSNRP